MSVKIKSEIELLRKALNLTPDNVNYRFSTWGEFNGGYLIHLSETEQEQFWHLCFKFALIHNDVKHGRHISIHDDVFGYRTELDRRLEGLKLDGVR